MSFVDTEPIYAHIKTARYAENRDHLLEYQKQWQQKNHDKFIQYQKDYYNKTKDIKKEQYNMLIHCDCCNKDVRRGSISVHRKSKKHMLRSADMLLHKPIAALAFEDETIVYIPLTYR
jgi:hypothetical protein